jgi:hypothetical protein
MVTEESESRWAERRDQLGLKDNIDFLIRPFRNKASWDSWKGLLAYLAGLCQRQAYDLVVFDPLVYLWPVRDENDASQVEAALMPLHGLGEATTPFLVHHNRKGDGQEGTASRGSGALPGFVDTIMELRRYDRANLKDRKRVLAAYGRHDETPAELVVELTEDGQYVSHGSKGETVRVGLTVAIARLLPNEPPGMGTENILQSLPDELRPTKGKLIEVLQGGVGRNEWRREGAGKKGSPFTFWIPAP